MDIRRIMETVNMIDNENLDLRTTTMGISLLDCIDSDSDRACQKIYDKITTKAEKPPIRSTPTALAALSKVMAYLT